MIAVFKIIQVFLLATVKYVFSYPYALLIGLNFEQTLIAVTLGGIAGFFFFYHFSGFAIQQLNHFVAFLWRNGSHAIRAKMWQFIAWSINPNGRRVFTKRNRYLANFRAKYGMAGIIIASPVILSLPLGAFLLNKYYPKHKFALPYMVLSILSWTAVFVAFALIFPHLVR